MRDNAVEEIKKILASDRRRRIWKRIVGVLACLVVFCTTYVLILPALTLEKTPACGKTEHTHTEACYAQNPAGTVPVCTPEGLGLHQHTESCYGAAGELACGYADFVVHRHDAACRDASGALWCFLPEIEVHTHTASCYAAPGTEPVHTHTDACYATERGELICGLEEGVSAHAHTDECYQAEQAMACSVPESEGHRHNDACYDTDGAVICGLEESEGHTHGEGCYEAKQELTCQLSEEPHQHTDACYAQSKTLTCELPEEAALQEPAGEEEPSSGDPAESELACGKEEIILHEHVGACFDENGNLICGQVQVLEHRHTDACFRVIEETVEARELICGMEEHIHTDDCYPQQQEPTENVLYICGMEEHTHGEDCYSEGGELLCTMEEHTHTEECRLFFADSSMEEPGMGDLPSADGAAADGAAAIGEQKLPVTAITGSGTTYDPKTGDYTTGLKINFTFTGGAAQSGVDYVFAYPKEVLVPDGLIGQQKPLYDGDRYAGTYTFVKNADGTSSVKVNFDQEYIDNAGETVTGFVDFKGTLRTQSGSDGSITIKVGGDNLQIVIPPDEIEYPSDETERYDIDVQKSGSFVEKDGNKLVYTVYVRSRKGTPKEIHFRDLLTASGLTLDKPTVTVEQGTYEYHNQYDQRYQKNWTAIDTPADLAYDNGHISMTLPGLAPGVEQSGYILGNCYKITYTYDLSRVPSADISPRNEVAVTSTDTQKGQTVTDKADTTVHIKRAYTLSKKGAYNSADGTITWTITVNDNKMDIAGAWLTDDMLAQLAQGTDVKVEPGNGYQLVTDKDGKITGILFTDANGDGTNTNKYTITYRTTAQPGWNQQMVNNTANFTSPDGSSTAGATGGVSIPGSGGVDKAHGTMAVSPDGTTGAIPWTVTVDVPAGGLPAGAVIEDSISGNGHWMTHEQAAAMLAGLRWADGTPVIVEEANVELKNSWYNYKSYPVIMGSPNAEDQHLIGFRITFPEGLMSPDGKAQKLIFSYTTTVDLTQAGIGTTNYTNYVEVAGKKDTDSYPYHRGGVVKTDGSGQTGTSHITTTGDTLTWKVKVDMDGVKHPCLTLGDTLPAGVTLSGISVSGGAQMELMIREDGTITGESTDHNVRIQGTYRNNLVDLTMTGEIGKDAHYEFTFVCKADPALLDGEKHSLTNHVTVTTDQGELGSSQQTQEWTHKKEEVVTKVLDKSGTWDNDSRRLSYSIVINPEGKDLLEGVDELTLVDVLTYNSKLHFYYPNKYEAEVNVTLLPNTVKLYRAVKDPNGSGWIKGREVNDWKWAYAAEKKDDYDRKATNTITAAGIPDSTPLIMEYAYSVSSTIMEGDSADLVISNTARLEGTIHQTTGGLDKKKWEDQTSSGAVTTNKTYTFYKVEEGKFNRTLEGAKFTVYQYNQETGKCDIRVTEYATDQDGSFRIRRESDEEKALYQYNTLYMVKETEAPEHYKLPDPVPEYYFCFSNEMEGAGSNLPDPLPENTVDLSKTERTVYAENVRNATDIVVKKVWQDASGNTVSHNADTTITVNVYQKKSDTSSGGSGGGSGGTSLTGEIKFGGDSGGILKQFNDIYPAGTNLTFSIISKVRWQGEPTLYFNGQKLAIENAEIYKDQDNNPTGGRYTYSVTLQDGNNRLSGYTAAWDSTCSDWEGFTVVSAPTPDEPDPDPEFQDLLIATVTLNAKNDWREELLNLPLSVTEGDTTCYYTYYVKEVSVPNYTTTYVNNNGITSGTITVVNKLEENPGHQLPATGGSGTRPYTIGGLLLTGAGAILLYSKRKRGRGAGWVF